MTIVKNRQKNLPNFFALTTILCSKFCQSAAKKKANFYKLRWLHNYVANFVSQLRKKKANFYKHSLKRIVMISRKQIWVIRSKKNIVVTENTREFRKMTATPPPPQKKISRDIINTQSWPTNDEICIFCDT